MSLAIVHWVALTIMPVVALVALAAAGVARLDEERSRMRRRLGVSAVATGLYLVLLALSFLG